MANVGGAARPVLLMDEYKDMKDGISLFDSTKYMGYNFEKYGVAPIISGSFKVAFVAVLETLISARIADNKTGKFFTNSLC